MSDDVILVRGDASDALPGVAWAQVSGVPAPATASSLLAGLPLLGQRLWRGDRPACADSILGPIAFGDELN